MDGVFAADEITIVVPYWSAAGALLSCLCVPHRCRRRPPWQARRRRRPPVSTTIAIVSNGYNWIDGLKVFTEEQVCYHYCCYPTDAHGMHDSHVSLWEYPLAGKLDAGKILHTAFRWRLMTPQCLLGLGEVKRVTKETNVHVKINLDGAGVANCSTGIPFLDHMPDCTV